MKRMITKKSDEEMLLGTHLFNHENDIRGLQKVAEHLNPGGLLVLSVHSPHENRDLTLNDGIIYHQKIGPTSGTEEHFFFEKTYSFTKEGKLLAEETLTLGFYKSKVFFKMLADIGLEPLEDAHTDKFYVFQKIA